MKLGKQAPTSATLANAGVGVAACGFAVSDAPELAALMILLAVLLDSLDGALARSLDAASEFGAQLDPMADLISFGMAPAVLVGSLMAGEMRHIGWLMIMAYPLCTAWRLARFNALQVAGSSKHGSFQGLPSTGAGAAAATAVLFHTQFTGVPQATAMLPWALVVLGVLMDSSAPYKHAAAILARMKPSVTALIAASFITACVLWAYEYMFAALVWGYVVSGPFAFTRERIRAVRHA